MSLRVTFIERKVADSVSIENVFSCIAEKLKSSGLSVVFQKLPFGNGFRDIIRNLIGFSPAGSDVYHITGHVHYAALRLPRHRTVLTVHDLTILHFRTGLRRAILKALFFDLPVRRLDFITTVSENTKRELIAATGCSESKITVIPNPLLIEPRENTKPFDAVSTNVLQIGTAKNKNVENLIRALAPLGCRLTIVGHLTDGQRELLRETDLSFQQFDSLDSEGMNSAYADADIVSFCSTHEGFGLPIIEAQAFGKPVITSDRDPMRDVGGDGAVLVDPDEVAAIRDGIRSIVENEELRVRIVAAGYANLDRFKPGSIAAQYMDLYRRVTLQ